MSEKTKVRWKATYKWELQSVHFCKEDSFFYFFALLTCLYYQRSIKNCTLKIVLHYVLPECACILAYMLNNAEKLPFLSAFKQKNGRLGGIRKVAIN